MIFIFFFLFSFLSLFFSFFLYIIVFRLKIAKPNQLSFSWEVNSQVYDVLKIPWTSQGTGLGSKDIHVFTPWEYISERGGCSQWVPTQCEPWLQPLTSSSLLLHPGSLPPWHHIATCTPASPNWVINTCSSWQTKFPLPARSSRTKGKSPENFMLADGKLHFLQAPGTWKQEGMPTFETVLLSLTDIQRAASLSLGSGPHPSFPCPCPKPWRESPDCSQGGASRNGPISLIRPTQLPDPDLPRTVTREAQPDDWTCAGDANWLSPELMMSQEWATRGKTKQVSLAAGCCTVNREYLAAPVHRDNPWSVPHSDLSLYFPPLHLGLSPRSTGYSGLAAQTQGLAGEYTQHHSRCQWP